MADDPDFDAEIAKMEKIAEAVKRFDSPEVQAKVFARLDELAFGRTPGASKSPTAVRSNPGESDTVDLDPLRDFNDESKPKATAKKATSRRSGRKATYSATKDINFAPTGEVSWREFASTKAPGTLPEKAVVAVYYMQETLKRKVSTGDVIAAFNLVGWRNPADPANNLQVAAARAGWLDTSDMSDIKIVWAGQNYVEHDLPKAPSPKK